LLDRFTYVAAVAVKRCKMVVNHELTNSKIVRTFNLSS
jgi:hypothetical protein